MHNASLTVRATHLLLSPLVLFAELALYNIYHRQVCATFSSFSMARRPAHRTLPFRPRASEHIVESREEDEEGGGERERGGEEEGREEREEEDGIIVTTPTVSFF